MKLARTALLIPLVLAACSGGGAATSAPGGTTAAPSGASTAAPATQGSAPSDRGAATMTPAETTSAGGGGGSASAWCLNTVDEVSAAIGVSGLTATGSDTPGVGGGCFYSDGTGALVYSVAVVNNSSVQAAFDAGKQAPGAVTISGIGKDAVLVSGAGPLVVLTDKGMISLGPTTPELIADAAAYRTAAEALARTAVNRIP